MKILLLRPLNPFFESSASGNRFAGIIDGLLKQGVKVTLVVTGGYNDVNEYKEIRKNKKNENLTVIYTVCTFSHKLWLRRMNVFLLSWLFALISNIKLKRLFNADFDFVWLTNNGDILAAFNKNFGLIKGKTIIELNEFNDFYKGEGQIGNPLQLRKAEMSNQNFLKAVKKIDLFAVMTFTLIRHFQTLAKPDAHFFHLPMTVDMKRFQAIQKTNNYNKPYIAFTGTYTNTKDGVDVLIHAFAKTNKLYPDFHLYLAGFYHYDVPMQKKLIEDYQLNNKITYLGILNKYQIPEFLQNADLLVLSRPDSHQAQGGFPTKLGEYLATGNPVCVTRVGEIPDYLEDNVSAFMAEPGSVDSFADAMNRALSDKENARRVGLNGRKVAEEHFSIDVQAERLIKFF
ncbi:MAG: glycosyltransferase family 4 protein [Paludibacter sp.]|nr:glycosyltransferase family 4 protein [Paludibacter sp.]